MNKNKIFFIFSVFSALQIAYKFNVSYVNHFSQQTCANAVFLAITLSSILVQTRMYDHHYFDSNDYHKSVKFRNRIKFSKMIVSIVSFGILLINIYKLF